ncbi:hypothetical protein BpHYR1_053965 [Brachionus plicatilis]|uniref:Uncharacterized protein n=1 Tax=Brachionus plicatilis TaxID=10195 RepID=A0A3M7RB21_BRAPC|nr:hypothetical protein BpHYR1_053965 [Brachionus plicatilis]
MTNCLVIDDEILTDVVYEFEACTKKSKIAFNKDLDMNQMMMWLKTIDQNLIISSFLNADLSENALNISVKI